MSSVPSGKLFLEFWRGSAVISKFDGLTLRGRNLFLVVARKFVNGEKNVEFFVSVTGMTVPTATHDAIDGEQHSLVWLCPWPRTRCTM